MVPLPSPCMLWTGQEVDMLHCEVHGHADGVQWHGHAKRCIMV
jgi:hypothetical protein